MLILQANDAVVSFRLVIFEPMVQLFYTKMQNIHYWGEGKRGECVTATPLTCCVGCRSSGQGPQQIPIGVSVHIGPSRSFSEGKFARKWLFLSWKVVMLQVAKACSAPAK